MPKNKAWFRMEQKSPDLAEVCIFDEIDSFGGIGPDSFKKSLDAVKGASTIKLLLNSPGGSVFDGMTIYHMLSAHRAKLDIEVLGVAASIASIIALAGRKLTMAKGAYYMIHNPLSIMAGDAEGLRKTADVLDKMKGDFLDIYEERSGKTREDISALMDAETWYTSEEAVTAGFADEVKDFGQIAARMDNPISRQFAKIPKSVMMRSEGITTARQLEDALRDAGLTRKAAEAIVADGWKGMADQGDPEPATQGDPVKAPGITPAMRIKDRNSRIRIPTS